MSALRVLAGVLLIACSEPSKEAPAPIAEAPKPTGPVELKLPYMGVALTVPADWKTDHPRDQLANAQVVYGPQMNPFVTVSFVGERIDSLDDAKRVIPERMHSSIIVGLREAQELSSSALVLAYNTRIKPDGKDTSTQLRVILKGDKPVSCNASNAGGFDLELLRGICATMRWL